MEHERWREALEQLFVARRIFEPFAKVGDYEQQEVFRQQIEQTDASIRYCNYHLGSNADEVKKLIIKDSSDPLSAKLEVLFFLKIQSNNHSIID